METKDVFLRIFWILERWVLILRVGFLYNGKVGAEWARKEN